MPINFTYFNDQTQQSPRSGGGGGGGGSYSGGGGGGGSSDRQRELILQQIIAQGNGKQQLTLADYNAQRQAALAVGQIDNQSEQIKNQRKTQIDQVELSGVQAQMAMRDREMDRRARMEMLKKQQEAEAKQIEDARWDKAAYFNAQQAERGAEFVEGKRRFDTTQDFQTKSKQAEAFEQQRRFEEGQYQFDQQQQQQMEMQRAQFQQQSDMQIQGAEVQNWLHQQDLGAKDMLRMKELQEAVADVEKADILPHLKQDLLMQIKAKVSPLQARMKEQQIRHEEQEGEYKKRQIQKMTVDMHEAEKFRTANAEELIKPVTLSSGRVVDMMNLGPGKGWEMLNTSKLDQAESQFQEKLALQKFTVEGQQQDLRVKRKQGLIDLISKVNDQKIKRQASAYGPDGKSLVPKAQLDAEFAELDKILASARAELGDAPEQAKKPEITFYPDGTRTNHPDDRPAAQPQGGAMVRPPQQFDDKAHIVASKAATAEADALFKDVAEYNKDQRTAGAAPHPRQPQYEATIQAGLANSKQKFEQDQTITQGSYEAAMSEFEGYVKAFGYAYGPDGKPVTGNLDQTLLKKAPPPVRERMEFLAKKFQGDAGSKPLGSGPADWKGSPELKPKAWPAEKQAEMDAIREKIKNARKAPGQGDTYKGGWIK